MEEYHRPVLLREVIEALKVRRGRWYLDATLGDGGHSLEILKKGGNVIGVDVDPQALERARERFEQLETEEFGEFRLIQGNFRDIKNLLYQHALPKLSAKGEVRQRRQRGEQTDTRDLKFAGSIFDLGVSSLQLSNPERGFSFSKAGPLDMRMDPSLQVRALDLVNALSRKELYELFKNLGEEKYSRSVANALVLARQVRTGLSFGDSTHDLAKLVEDIYRKVGVRNWQIHPATKVFQALRIAVNDELEALKEGLSQAIDLIEKNGVICVISFHSLEDRIVKITFRQWERENLGNKGTKKPIIPKEAEISENPRSRSAKMRIFYL